jgi:hypothetical protein
VHGLTFLTRSSCAFSASSAVLISEFSFIRRDSIGHGVLFCEASTLPDYPGLPSLSVLFYEALRAEKKLDLGLPDIYLILNWRLDCLFVISSYF